MAIKASKASKASKVPGKVRSIRQVRVSITPELGEAIVHAHEAHPDLSASQLIERLAIIGGGVRHEAPPMTRREVIEKYAGTIPYPPNYLEDLRSGKYFE